MLINLIQTYNVEDPVSDSDELATRPGIRDGLQCNNPLEEPGDHIDDEDVGAALSDLTASGVDIDGDEVPIFVLCQPETFGQLDLLVDVDLVQEPKLLVIHLDPGAINDNNFPSILTDQKIHGRDLWRELGEYLTLVAVSDQLLAEETDEGSVMENGQLGHRDLEILDIQIAGGDNGLATSRILPQERRQILESKHLFLLHVGCDGFRLRLGGDGADGGLPQAALLVLTEVIAGGDVGGGTLPAGVTLVDGLTGISFAMTRRDR